MPQNGLATKIADFKVVRLLVRQCKQNLEERVRFSKKLIPVNPELVAQNEGSVENLTVSIQ